MITTDRQLDLAGTSLIAALLEEQQDLTAVERFSQAHADAETPLLERHYRDLIDIDGLAPDEQLAFEVDLDTCSGCKACVVACHNLNGLEEEETWRSVGVLTDARQSSGEATVAIQHVTTACHHCVEPGCLEGCPVVAYEKDEVTGIVRHLDDQCIGCQYCTWMCPYNVPQYSQSKGIVRKCDMCHDRLASGEAPACVQSCPNGAIRIRKVKKAEAATVTPSSRLVPGSAPSSITKPTTRFVSDRELASTHPGDHSEDKPEHAHWPLIIMLTLTQASVGIVALAFVASLFVRASDTLSLLSIAVGTALVGLIAATFHLGRPHLGFRSFLGLRTSWLSREAVAFGVYFAAVAGTLVATYFRSSGTMVNVGLAMSALLGLLGVASSTMIYVATRRPFWSLSHSAFRFASTMVLFATTVFLLVRPESAPACLVGLSCAIVQVVFAYIAYGFDEPPSTRTTIRSIRLLQGPLSPTSRLHLASTLGQCVFLGLVMLGGERGAAVGSLVSALFAAVSGYYLFFSAVVPFRMPGVQAT